MTGAPAGEVASNGAYSPALATGGELSSRTVATGDSDGVRPHNVVAVLPVATVMSTHVPDSKCMSRSPAANDPSMQTSTGGVYSAVVMRSNTGPMNVAERRRWRILHGLRDEVPCLVYLRKRRGDRLIGSAHARRAVECGRAGVHEGSRLERDGRAIGPFPHPHVGFRRSEQRLQICVRDADTTQILDEIGQQAGMRRAVDAVIPRLRHVVVDPLRRRGHPEFSSADAGRRHDVEWIDDPSHSRCV